MFVPRGYAVQKHGALMPSWGGAVSVALLCLAWGCGKEAPVCPEPAPFRQDVIPQSPVLPGPNAGTVGGAADMVGLVARQWATVRTFKAHYESWEKGGEVESSTVDFWLKRPGQYRYEVSKSSVGIKNGSKSVFDTRTRRISSKPGGALSLITLSGTLDDSRSKSARGYTLDQSDYGSLVEMLTAPQASVTAVPGRLNVVVVARPSKLRDIEAMRVTLDGERGFLTGVEMLVSNQVVMRKAFSLHAVNPSIDAKRFEL